jgi:hypothetical protein
MFLIEPFAMTVEAGRDFLILPFKDNSMDA